MNRQDAIEEALLMHLHRIDALVAKLIDLRVNHFIMPSPEECELVPCRHPRTSGRGSG